jgi:hypothetical protein
MKKNVLIIVISCLMLGTAYSQENTYHSIQEAINHHIEQLKANVRHYDNVFVITKLEDDITLPEKALKVEDGLDGKFLKKEDQNFLVEIKIETKVNYLKIGVTNYRVVKLSNKKLKLLNLSNGQTYIIK